MNDADAWRREVEEYRRAKDDAFRNDSGSPIPHAERGSFRGLRYFPPDPAYRVAASLERLAPSDPVTFPAVTGGEHGGVFARYANATFRLPAGPGTLTLLAAEHDHEGHSAHEPHELFLPFRDATGGKETYGAGRYIEVPNGLGPGDDIGDLVIDLNYAYNPYCAYSEDYVCPMPPAENWLKVAVRAGERSYKDES